MSADDVIARAFAEIERRGLVNVHRRFVGYDRISTRSDRRANAEQVARANIAQALAKAGLTVKGNAPASIVFSRLRNNGHVFELTIERIEAQPSGSVAGSDLDEDLAIELLDLAVHAMQLGELAWTRGEVGRESLTVGLLERDAPTRDTKPDDETDVVRIVLYRDHGHFGDRDTLPPGFTRCRTCDRRAEKVTTALRRFREGRR